MAYRAGARPAPLAESAFGQCGLNRRVQNVGPSDCGEASGKPGGEKRKSKEIAPYCTLASGCEALHAKCQRSVNDHSRTDHGHPLNRTFELPQVGTN